MESQDAIVLIMLRNAFYRRMHYLALAALILAFLVNVALAGIFIYLYKNPTHPIYFAADKVGRLIQIIPVNTPNMSQAEVDKWTINAVQAAYSFDYINYRAQLQDAEKYFTTYGWSRYMKALTASSNLVALTERKQIVIATVVGQPKILVQGTLGGAYAWKYQMPLLVTYSQPPYDAKNQFSNALDVTVIVQRKPVLQGNKGLGIVQLIASLATQPAPQTPTISDTNG